MQVGKLIKRMAKTIRQYLKLIRMIKLGMITTTVLDSKKKTSQSNKYPNKSSKKTRLVTNRSNMRSNKMIAKILLTLI